jgi:threonine dehydrogenase-like Zn-dependent dehydrogenase
MHALVRRDSGTALIERDEPVAGPGEVLVAVKVAGVCRTDVSVARGEIEVPEPRILGHEASGVIVALGEGVDRRVGEPVALWPMNPCGACARCHRGAFERCPHATQLGVHRDGVFAPLVALPAQHAIACGSLSPLLAAYLEPCCAAFSVGELGLDRNPGAGAIVGDNRVAKLTALVLESLGFEGVRTLSLEELEATPDDALRWVVESAPSEALLSGALRVLRPGGLLVLRSRPPRPVAIDLRIAVQKELRFEGRQYGSLESARALLEREPVRVAALLGEVFSLERWEEAFFADRAQDKKVFLAPDPTRATAW